MATYGSTEDLEGEPDNGTKGNDEFGIFGPMGELLEMIKKHMDFMAEQEASVDKYIANAGSSATVLTAAKNSALETETDLMNQILDPGNLAQFTNNIILIENLFNARFDAEQRKRQKQARQKHAANIAKYEAKPKATSDVSSFIDLMFAGVSVYLPVFDRFLERVEEQCKAKGIKMVSNSGAKAKNIQRAFYKSFYVYAINYGDAAFRQMTDVLRCSLVFDEFDDLYQCFSVIEQLAHDDEKSEGILRVKDRFNPDSMPFGYRDLLINMYCPGSKVVCEIQLHHVLFYSSKKISHRMYKKARLFEEGDDNLAYLYADRRVRKKVGDKVYELQPGDEGHDDEEEEEVDESLFEKHDLEMTLNEAFEKYKGGLSKFVQKFYEDGYGEESEQIHQFIEDLPYYDEIDEVDPSNKESYQELADYGFKIGHIKKYKKMLSELKAKRGEFEKLQAKRAKVKQQQPAPQQPQQNTAKAQPAAAEQEEKKQAMHPVAIGGHGNKGYYCCKKCDSPLAAKQDIESRKHVILNGNAFFFKNAVNTTEDEPRMMQLNQGAMTCADSYCAKCETHIGLKFISGRSAATAQFVGKFVFNRSLLAAPEPELVALQEAQVYSCKQCGTQLALAQDVKSRQHRWMNGQAFLFEKGVNLSEDAPRTEHLGQGAMQISDVYCAKCETELGIKFISANDQKNNHFLGQVVLTRSLICSPQEN